MDMNSPRPDYDKPPIAEVALAVQFDKIQSLRTPQIGVLWQEFRDRFPVINEQLPIEPMIERFGSLGGGTRVTIQGVPSVNRCWFLNKSSTELIQVQADMFIHNWKKTNEQPEYPRYDCLRDAFVDELKTFCSFLDREELGELNPNQCEVTYVNHIMSGENWSGFGDLGEILTVFEPQYSDDFLFKPEDVQTTLRYVLCDAQQQPIGRLHVNINSAYRSGDDHPMYVMTLTARGRPIGEGIEGALRFLDLGREWVVRGFTSITTSKMHKEWRRKDVT